MLDLSGQQIDESGIEEMLTDDVTVLNLNNTEMLGFFDEMLIERLQKHKKLANLILSNNNFADLDGLCEILQANQSLTHFDLSNSILGTDGAKQILTAIINNPNIKISSIKLINNCVDCIDQDIIDGLLKKGIEELILDENTLNLSNYPYSTIHALFSAVTNNNTLQQLSLARTKIIAADIAHIIKSLTQNMSLKILDLSECRAIRANDVLQLVEGIKNKDKSFKLILGEVEQALAERLTSLTDLNITLEYKKKEQVITYFYVQPEAVEFSDDKENISPSSSPRGSTG